MLLLACAITTTLSAQSRLTVQQKPAFIENARFQHFPEKAYSTGMQKLDSIVSQDYDPDTFRWTISEKQEYGFDSQGRILSMASYLGHLGQDGLTGRYRLEYTYGTDGTQIDLVDYSWDFVSGSWAKKGLTTFLYDDGNLITQKGYFWNSTTNEWIYTGEWVITYTNGLMTTSSNTTTDFNADGIVNYLDWSRWEFSYDASGNMLTDSNMTYLSDSLKWVDNTKTWYTYSEANLRLSATSFMRNPETYSMDKTYKEEYTWNEDGKQVLNASYTWDRVFSEWIGFHRSELEYDQEHELKSLISSFWEPDSGTWLPDTKTNYSNDPGIESKQIMLPENYIKTFKYKLTGYSVSYFDDPDWTLFEKVNFYYSSQSGSGKTENPLEDISLFPNPAKDYLRITGEFSTGGVVVAIFNSEGKEIKSIRLTVDRVIPVNDLAPGVYLYKISNSTNTKTGKLVIE